ncbi:MAG: dihydroorotate dehydrogenase [Candidatus Aminicenantes bacterium]|nr:dihydroorotate dehydrogenase [Candidatus Aminicenantes bacterium]
MTDLSVNLGFMTLKNPVIAASGTFGYGLEFIPFIDLNRLGGFVVKGLYFSPRQGNPPPRLVETASGLINAIGLQGIGVRRFSEEILPQLRGFRTAVIVNVCGEHEEEYASIVEYLDNQEGIAAYELNISCPNVKKGGQCPALDPNATHAIVKLVKNSSSRPIITKLSPNVSDIVEIALSAQEAGSDAISLVNTFLAMAVDTETRIPKLANVFGGLSGPAIKPIALRMVYQVSGRLDIPVIGLGGIMTAEDALEYLICGARAVEVGTANFVDPETTVNIVDSMEAYCKRHNIPKIEDIIGTLDTQF